MVVRLLWKEKKLSGGAMFMESYRFLDQMRLLYK